MRQKEERLKVLVLGGIMREEKDDFVVISNAERRISREVGVGGYM